MRRFTRLTNGFSKKFENHAHMVALYAVWYNFLRIHKTLKITPAMAAGIAEAYGHVGYCRHDRCGNGKGANGARDV